MSKFLVCIMLFLFSNVLYAAEAQQVTIAGYINSGKVKPHVTIIEYADYQCPFCVSLSNEVEPLIRKEYVATGKVDLVYKNFQFLGKESIDAAVAAECAKEQGQFWPFHDALYRAKYIDYANGGGENDGFYNVKLFDKIAQQLNLNKVAFDTCYANTAIFSRIQNETNNAMESGVAATPTIYINDKLISQPDYSSLRTAIEAELNGST